MLNKKVETGFLDELHEFFSDNSQAYKKWHQSKLHSHCHFGVFITFLSATFTTVYATLADPSEAFAGNKIYFIDSTGNIEPIFTYLIFSVFLMFVIFGAYLLLKRKEQKFN